MTQAEHQTRRQILAKLEPKLKKVCAWCHPGLRGPNLSHGICARHKAEMIAQIPTTT